MLWARVPIYSVTNPAKGHSQLRMSVFSPKLQSGWARQNALGLGDRMGEFPNCPGGQVQRGQEVVSRLNSRSQAGWEAPFLPCSLEKAHSLYYSNYSIFNLFF